MQRPGEVPDLARYAREWPWLEISARHLTMACLTRAVLQVGTGLEKSKVLVNLAWAHPPCLVVAKRAGRPRQVSGGGPSNDKHVDYGPIGRL